jgi:hypothetical protein
MKNVVLLLVLAVHGTSGTVKELSPMLAAPSAEKCKFKFLKFILKFYFDPLTFQIIAEEATSVPQAPFPRQIIPTIMTTILIVTGIWVEYLECKAFHFSSFLSIRRVAVIT